MAVTNLLDSQKRQTVFKYLDIPKFLSLITSKQIVFSKSDLFEDADEGILPDFTRLREETEPLLNIMRVHRADTDYLDNFISEIINEPLHNERINIYRAVFIRLYLIPLHFYGYITPELAKKINYYSLKFTDAFMKDDRNAIKNVFLELDSDDIMANRDINKFYRDNTYISCWHMARSESDAMWKIYSKQEGVAIKTTADKLINYLDFTSFEKNSYIPILDKVHYVKNLQTLRRHVNSLGGNDLVSEGFDDAVKFFFIKKMEYAHEKELRLLIYRKLSPSSDINSELSKDIQKVSITCELDDFIDKIIISPFAPSYYGQVLSDTLNSMGLKNLSKKIKKSSMPVN